MERLEGFEGGDWFVRVDREMQPHHFYILLSSHWLIWQPHWVPIGWYDGTGVGSHLSLTDICISVMSFAPRSGSMIGETSENVWSSSHFVQICRDLLSISHLFCRSGDKDRRVWAGLANVSNSGEAEGRVEVECVWSCECASPVQLEESLVFWSVKLSQHSTAKHF